MVRIDPTDENLHDTTFKLEILKKKHITISTEETGNYSSILKNSE